MKSRITVICPTFNQSIDILHSINSVRAQTVQDWELVVVSDGCTDDTDNVVQAVPDPRVRLLRVANHGSPGGPRNAALITTTTPYVAYLDHDDRWHPEHLELLLDMLQTGAQLASTGCVRIDSAGHECDRSGDRDTVWHPELQVLNAMYEPSRVGHVRSLVTDIGGWNTERAGFEDWDLWFRLAESGVDFATAEYRTATLVLNDSSRRHAFQPRHSIGLAATETEQRARQIQTCLADPEVRHRANESYLTDMLVWYETLWNSPRCVRPSNVRLVDVITSMRAKVARGEAGSFLHNIEVMPHGENYVLALPTAVLTQRHRSRIRELLATRSSAQLALLQELLSH